MINFEPVRDQSRELVQLIPADVCDVREDVCEPDLVDRMPGPNRVVEVVGGQTVDLSLAE